MKCVLLRKRLKDSNNRTRTIEFVRQGGLCALLSYLEQATNEDLSPVDGIPVSKTIQCIRTIMNIDELFQYIATGYQHIDSIVKSRIKDFVVTSMKKIYVSFQS